MQSASRPRSAASSQFLLPRSEAVDVIERIKSQLSANPVVLYMKGTPDFPQCGFSAAAVRALSASGAQFAHVNIFEDPELREALKQYSNWPTYPQLYVNGELVGGSDIILEMYKSGELQKLVSWVRLQPDIDTGIRSGCRPDRTAPPCAPRRTPRSALRSNPRRCPPPAAPCRAPSARTTTPASVAVSKLENG